MTFIFRFAGGLDDSGRVAGTLLLEVADRVRLFERLVRLLRLVRVATPLHPLRHALLHFQILRLDKEVVRIAGHVVVHLLQNIAKILELCLFLFGNHVLAVCPRDDNHQRVEEPQISRIGAVHPVGDELPHLGYRHRVGIRLVSHVAQDGRQHHHSERLARVRGHDDRRLLAPAVFQQLEDGPPVVGRLRPLVEVDQLEAEAHGLLGRLRQFHLVAVREDVVVVVLPLLQCRLDLEFIAARLGTRILRQTLWDIRKSS